MLRAHALEFVSLLPTTAPSLLENPGYMPHFPAWADRGFAVEMHAGTRRCEPFGVVFDFAPDQVDHLDPPVANWRCERPSSNRADVLLELRDRCAVNRPVPGIVHAWRDLVHQQRRRGTFRHHEHLDSEHADIIERLGDTGCDAAGFLGDARGDRRRHPRYLENMIAMLVLGRVETFDPAIRAARRYDRDLALEGHECLEDRRLGTACLESCGCLAALPDHGLALAVISETPGLEHGGLADLLESGRDLLG